MAKYVAGRCNIGLANRFSRILIGLVWLAIAFSIFFWLKANDWPSWIRVFLFFPLYGSLLGIFQGMVGFCVLTAREGKFDLR